jgi:hypothetical protein
VAVRLVPQLVVVLVLRSVLESVEILVLVLVRVRELEMELL